MAQIIDNSDFSISSSKEIISIIENMVKQRTGLHIDADGKVGLMSAVIGVSVDNKYVFFDVSSDDEINDKIIESKTLKFVTNSGVKIRWHGSNLRFVGLDDGNAFEMPVPKIIERVQRREFFRLNTSQIQNALLCTISNSAESVTATIADMSIGGIGVLHRGRPPSFLSKGMNFEKCSINFPEAGKVQITLKVCSIFPAAKAKNGDSMYHIGLRFVKTGPVVRGLIQRQMAQLQQE